jgi:hypothetical protein
LKPLNTFKERRSNIDEKKKAIKEKALIWMKRRMNENEGKVLRVLPSDRMVPRNQG